MMWNLLKSRMVREEGQSLVEYALIIALVAIVLVAGLPTTASGIGEMKLWSDLLGAIMMIVMKVGTL